MERCDPARGWGCIKGEEVSLCMCRIISSPKGLEWQGVIRLKGEPGFGGRKSPVGLSWTQKRLSLQGRKGETHPMESWMGEEQSGAQSWAGFPSARPPGSPLVQWLHQVMAWSPASLDVGPGSEQLFTRLCWGAAQRMPVKVPGT